VPFNKKTIILVPSTENPFVNVYQMSSNFLELYQMRSKLLESVLTKETMSGIINYHGNDRHKLSASTALLNLLSECARYESGFEKSPHTENIVSSKEKTLELMKLCIHYNMNNLMHDTISRSEIIKKCYLFQNECVELLIKVHPEFTPDDLVVEEIKDGRFIEPQLEKLFPGFLENPHRFKNVSYLKLYTILFYELNRENQDPYFVIMQYHRNVAFRITRTDMLANVGQCICDLTNSKSFTHEFVFKAVCQAVGTDQ